MPVTRAYKTIKDFDKAVGKLEKYIAFHAKKVKEAQIIRKVVLERKRSLQLKEARLQLKNGDKNGEDEQPKKGRPRKCAGRCTACINRFLKVKGGVSQHGSPEACRLTIAELNGNPLAAKRRYSRR